MERGKARRGEQRIIGAPGSPVVKQTYVTVYQEHRTNKTEIMGSKLQ